jgi:hypothetical protein
VEKAMTDPFDYDTDPRHVHIFTRDYLLLSGGDHEDVDEDSQQAFDIIQSGDYHFAGAFRNGDHDYMMFELD